jgi:hypothetical protein
VTTSRVTAAVMIISGLIAAGLPFLAWYAVETPRGTLTATGVAGTAELWSLPVLGGLIAVAGVFAATGRWGRSPAIFVTLAAAICVAWAVENAVNVPVGLLLVEPGGSAGRVADDLVEVSVQPSAYMAAAAAAIAGMAAMVRRLDQIA